MTFSKPADKEFKKVESHERGAKDEHSDLVPNNTSEITDDKTQPLKEFDKSSQSPKKDEEESAVMKMIKENSINPVAEADVPSEIAFPDVQKKIKGILEDEATRREETSTSGIYKRVEKKIKKYESPLEFLRLPKNKYDASKVKSNFKITHKKLSWRFKNFKPYSVSVFDFDSKVFFILKLSKGFKLKVFLKNGLNRGILLFSS